MYFDRVQASRDYSVSNRLGYEDFGQMGGSTVDASRCYQTYIYGIARSKRQGRLFAEV
jgi:hypothetical protein